jgi:hypothetical protein
MTRMAPSSTSLSASIAAADADADEQPTNVNYGAAAVAMAMAREDEPLLYNIPDGVHATYRPLPWLVQLGTILGSGFLSVVTTWNHITWMHPIVALQSRKVNVLTLVKFLVKVRSFVGDLEKQFYVSHFLFVIIIIISDSCHDALVTIHSSRPVSSTVASLHEHVASKLLSSFPTFQIRTRCCL